MIIDGHHSLIVMINMIINMMMIVMINMMINDETLEKEETALQMKFQDQILLQNFPVDDRDDDHGDDYHDHYDHDDNDHHGNCDHPFCCDNNDDDDFQR